MNQIILDTVRVMERVDPSPDFLHYFDKALTYLYTGDVDMACANLLHVAKHEIRKGWKSVVAREEKPYWPKPLTEETEATFPSRFGEEVSITPSHDPGLARKYFYDLGQRLHEVRINLDRATSELFVRCFVKDGELHVVACFASEPNP